MDNLKIGKKIFINKGMEVGKRYELEELDL